MMLTAQGLKYINEKKSDDARFNDRYNEMDILYNLKLTQSNQLPYIYTTFLVKRLQSTTIPIQDTYVHIKNSCTCSIHISTYTAPAKTRKDKKLTLDFVSILRSVVTFLFFSCVLRSARKNSPFLVPDVVMVWNQWQTIY